MTKSLQYIYSLDSKSRLCVDVFSVICRFSISKMDEKNGTRIRVKIYFNTGKSITETYGLFKTTFEVNV